MKLIMNIFPLTFTLQPTKTPLAFGREFELKAAPKATVDKDIQALADKITLGITDDYLQAKALYEWVSKEIRYVGDFIGENGYTPHDSAYILHRRFGDCKDHNNLLKELQSRYLLAPKTYIPEIFI